MTADITIRPFRPQDFAAVRLIWNQCCEAGETLYYPLTEDYFRKKFLLGDGCEKENLLTAEIEGRAAGFLHGVAPGTFALSRPGKAYLTCVFVDRSARGRGAARALVSAFQERMKARGADALCISSLNPVNLDWRIPGTPGHDHNNMPGADMEAPGYGFLEKMGFEPVYQEVAMYLDLSRYSPPPFLPAMRARLADQGIYAGPYDPDWNCEFDGMCDRVGSDYWRDVLRTEIAAWKTGGPNADPRMWADGIRPKGPRTLLTAVHENHIVGFTGPVDQQKSGRGWFTGICTDPLYERRGIATVLFHSLMEAFVREGAQFTTLFTGADNHAQKIYLGAGLRPVRRFALMNKGL